MLQAGICVTLISLDLNILINSIPLEFICVSVNKEVFSCALAAGNGRGARHCVLFGV